MNLYPYSPEYLQQLEEAAPPEFEVERLPAAMPNQGISYDDYEKKVLNDTINTDPLAGRQPLSQSPADAELLREYLMKNRGNADELKLVGGLTAALSAGAKGITGAPSSGVGEHILEQADKSEANRGNLIARYLALKQQQQSHLDNVALRKEALKSAEDFKLAMLGMRKDMQTAMLSEKDRARIEKQTAELSKRMESSGLADLGSVAETIENAFTGIQPGGDVPGYGATAGLPDIAITNKGQDVRQAVTALKNVVLKARSGGAVTPTEEKRMLGELGEGTTKTDRQLLQGISNVMAQLKAKHSAILGGYGDQVKSQYERQGGKLSFGEMPSLSNLLRAGKVKMVSPSGQTGYVPKEQVEKATKQGYKLVPQ